MKCSSRRKNRNKTDWTKYYEKKKSVFSTFTQKYTLEKINKFYGMAGCFSDIKEDLGNSVLELGGGNSCFAYDFCKDKKLSSYDIIDNNKLAVLLFERQKLNVGRHKGLLMNLTKEITPHGQYDFVYSVGLIEHFKKSERSMVIKNHFRYCKDNGYILISFPTPTRKYRFWRKCMELVGVWQFWDECPLKYDEIRQDIEGFGDVLAVELNKKLFLTQMLVFVKKRTL